MLFCHSHRHSAPHRVFGAKAYVNIPKDRRIGKFGDTSKEGILVGYRQGIPNWRILVSKNRVEYSHDAVFDETSFPGIPAVNFAGDSLPEEFEENDNDLSRPSIPSLTSELSNLINKEHDQPPEPPSTMVPDNSKQLLHQETNLDPSNILPSKRRAHLANKQLTTEPWYESFASSFSSSFCFSAVSTMSSYIPPHTYKQVMASPNHDEWSKAVNLELQAMERMGVWEEASEVLAGVPVLHTVWVFKKKFDANGNLVKYKARFLSEGGRRF
ncbi:hypothetical protein PSTT_01128 [Puccinia striiformis]|uniref:Retroviral polymerase SH3-like domain-containing protein n=1 Tax=Puccinia striiformis TaxID=27350 RepID=A0A2S4W4H0_9BASI|nr:hypothetical protein PSTT_01128 [Puccinia striiformis]